MPFQKITPRPFTLTGIHHYAPSDSGVYGISNSRHWIYIGETDNIRTALLDYFSNNQEDIQPAGFVYELCTAPDRTSRQDRLVSEYEPAQNRRGR